MTITIIREIEVSGRIVPADPSVGQPESVEILESGCGLTADEEDEARAALWEEANKYQP